MVDYILYGMRMDRRVMKELGRMGKEMGYVRVGMRMDRSGMKELTRMGN